MKIAFGTGAVLSKSLAKLCGGDLRVGRNPMPQKGFTGICTDSREADADTVFVALRGEHVDGHDYIEKAIENGCRCVICERGCEALQNVDAIAVSQSELALSRLANSFRKKLNCRTVGVTGSVGKTTTKDMISSVLSKAYKTYATRGNANSLIGLPLSVAEIPSDAAWAVLEMGMSGFGEIERLSVAAEPEFAVITNIGTSHLEMLGSRENICRAKLEILCGLREGGTLLLNGDEPLLEKIGGSSYRTVYVSIRHDADFSAQNIRIGSENLLFDLKWAGGIERDVCLRMTGKHNIYAALFAFAIGSMSGMTSEEIRAGLMEYEPHGIRQNRIECAGVTIFADCYNASPESMKAAIDTLSDYCKQTEKRGIAVLGDMLELGADSAALHRNVGEYLAKSGVRLLFTLGEGGSQIALGAKQNGMSSYRISQNRDRENKSKTLLLLESVIRPGDAILFKASRAVGAEELIESLKEFLQTGANA